jgi:hypothetical protein
MMYKENIVKIYKFLIHYIENEKEIRNYLLDTYHDDLLGPSPSYLSAIYTRR